MKKNYDSLLATLFYSTSQKLVNNVASLCQFKTKEAGVVLTFCFFFMALSTGQKAMAVNTPNTLFKSNSFYSNQFLASAITEGRSGGGGHGDDWVVRHQRDAILLGDKSGFINTINYN